MEWEKLIKECNKVLTISQAIILWKEDQKGLAEHIPHTGAQKLPQEKIFISIFMWRISNSTDVRNIGHKLLI